MPPADPKSPQLVNSEDSQPVAGQTLTLTRSGLIVNLNLAGDQKLDTATLSLQATGDEDSLTPVVTTDQGPVKGTWPAQVSWITADWGVDRPLTAIHVQTSTAGKARLKVFTAGNWLPLYPIDRVATGSEQRFPVVVASKVMVELVKPGQFPGVWEPDTAKVDGLVLKATSQPCDLSLAVAASPALFHQVGPLPAAPVEVNGLAEAVNAYLDNPKHVLPVPLRLQAAIPGKFQAQFSATALTVVRQLDNAKPDSALEIPWQGEAVGRITLSTSAVLKAVSFVPVAELSQEKLYLSPSSSETRLAQLCDPNHSAAQGFHIRLDEQALTGLDLYLYPRSPGFEAVLSLYPDLHGRPAPSPYTGITLPIHWQAANDVDHEGRWFSCQLSQPLQLQDENWWIVMTVGTGEVLWAMTDVAPAGVNGCLYQFAGGPWLPRLPPAAEPKPLWAQTRLRISAPGPKSLKPIILRRGEKSLTCSMDTEGRVQLDEKDLITLNQSIEPLLEIAVTAESAGTVSLRDLRILSAG